MNKLLIFMLGAAAGSVVTWKLVENKYKQLADEEIESVREHYKNKEKEIDRFNDMDHIHAWKEVSNSIVKDENDVEKEEYNDKLTDLGYSDGVEYPKEIDGYTIELEEPEDYIEPYVISPEEYCEIEGYDSKSWTCYSDMIITDEVGTIVTDPSRVIGDALSHFGDYADDSVYVRNENVECDYEILKYERSYAELNGSE